MIKVKEFAELTEKEKASIRELINDCVHYEQLELAVPDLNEEEGTAYLYYQSPKNPKLISVLFCYDLEDYLEVSAFTSPSHRCQGAFTTLFQKLIEGYEETPVCFYPDGNSYDALMTMEVLDCEYSGTEHLMRLDFRPKEPESSYTQPTVSLHPANEADLAALAAIHSAAFDMEEGESQAFLAQSFDSGETIWCITANTVDSANSKDNLKSANSKDNFKNGEPEKYTEASSKEQNTPLVGLVLTSIQSDQTSLYGLAIHPEQQGKGYGLAAVQALLQMPEIIFPVTLHVTEENEAAFKIYKGIGFVTTQELMEYWY